VYWLWFVVLLSFAEGPLYYKVSVLVNYSWELLTLFVVECCGVLWSVVECGGVLWSVVECCEMLWIVVECSGVL